MFACGQISPEEGECQEPLGSNNNLTVSEDKLTKEQKNDLFVMFGDDAIVKKDKKIEGIVLDKSQIEVISSSYRCKEPNFLTAFSEETFDAFPLDSNFEETLQVPSLDPIIEGCLTKRYGNKAAFSKSKSKSLFSQPAKMVEKINYKGQQAARLGLIIQMYIQQSLANLMQSMQSDTFQKEKSMQQVKDIFAMSTKCLDQIGRSGAFHHISRRAVAMKDTALYEQHDSLEFSILPLTGEGVFGTELETLLKSHKEKMKHVEELLPDLKKGQKRKTSGYQHDYNKRPAFDLSSEKPTTNNWNNFRIPKLSKDSRNDSRQNSYDSKYRRGYINSFRKPVSTTSGRGRLAKSDEK